LRWAADPAEEDNLLLQSRQNQAGKTLDFGPVATTGAFRLDTSHTGEWVLTPLPDSLPFAIQIKLDQLGAAGLKVTRVQPQDETGRDLAAAPCEQIGNLVSFNTTGAFAYRIWLSP